MNWILKNFFRGLIIVVPIALTIYLVYQAVVGLDRLLPLHTPGLGAVVIVLTIVLIGALAGSYVFRKFLQLTEFVFTKAPIVRIIYTAIKDLLEAFVGDRRRFDRPVVVSLTAAGDVKVMAFVTRDDLAELGQSGSVGVYVPFSYTWDGCFLMVPRDRVQPVEIDSASAMALAVSGGVSRV